MFFLQFKNAAEDYLRHSYGVGYSDLGITHSAIEVAYYSGETIKDFIDCAAIKRGVRKIPDPSRYRRNLMTFKPIA
jgi:hypothetical protein